MLDKDRIIELDTKSRIEALDEAAYKCERADQVVGSNFDNDAHRYIHDAEGIISIEREAIRIGQMSQPGWGRHGITYGSFGNIPGLFLSVFILNGHNGSQTCIVWTGRKKRIFWGILRLVFGRLPSGWLPKSLRIKIY